MSSKQKPSRVTPTAPSRRPFGLVILGLGVALVAGAALFRGSAPDGADGPPAPPARAAVVTTPPAGVAASAPQPAPRPVPPAVASSELPPLPYLPSPRAPEVVRAVYEFAARRPDVLRYVPCFCGCERQGHQANDDCFVAARDASGRVIAWEPHGAG